MYMVLPFTTDYNRVIASLDIETGNRTYVATRKEIFSFEVVIHNFVESIVLLDHPQAQSYSIFAVENANDSNDDEDLDFESTSEHLKLNRQDIREIYIGHEQTVEENLENGD
ncbi:hypothetical protein ACFE04_012435 [Oxalis oulophora]